MQCLIIPILCVLLLFTLIKKEWYMKMTFLVMLVIYYLYLSFPLYCHTKVEFEGVSLDPFNFFLILLSLFMLAVLHSNSIHYYKLNMTSLDMETLINMLFFICVLVFVSGGLLEFYVGFEISLIPIFLLILGWGYQPERQYAAFMMFFYTLTFSLPLLIIIAGLFSAGFSEISELGSQVMAIHSYKYFDAVMYFMIFAGFLVKFPIYWFHVWLPQAHVEAPLEGSMILAAILLKLGAMGMYNFSCFISTYSSFSYILFICVILGGAISTMLCIQHTDMKIIIAYSSVGHMSLAVGFLLSNLENSLGWLILILTIHGNISAALFYWVNINYESTHSRNIFFNSSNSLSLAYLAMTGFLLMLYNMSGPPSINMFVEIASSIILLQFNFWLLLPLFIMLLASSVFNMKLFVNSQSKMKSSFLKNLIIPDQSKFLILSSQIFVIIMYPLWFCLFF